MPLLWRSLRTKAPGREIQIIITARQFHYLGEGYVALAHIGCLPYVKGERRGEAKASPMWPWQWGEIITPLYHGGLSFSPVMVSPQCLVTISKIKTAAPPFCGWQCYFGIQLCYFFNL